MGKQLGKRVVYCQKHTERVIVLYIYNKQFYILSINTSSFPFLPSFLFLIFSMSIPCSCNNFSSRCSVYVPTSSIKSSSVPTLISFMVEVGGLTSGWTLALSAGSAVKNVTEPMVTTTIRMITATNIVRKLLDYQGELLLTDSSTSGVPFYTLNFRS